MKILLKSFLSIALLSSGVAFAISPEQQNEFIAMAKAKDYLGLRIKWDKFKAGKKLYMSQQEWIFFRDLFDQYPAIALNSVRIFDKGVRFSGKVASAQARVEALIAKAESLARAQQFLASAQLYERILTSLKGNMDKNPGPAATRNRELYYSLLHSWAQSLYGAGKYNDALEVYGWIPSGYSLFQDVVFEKIWASFYAGRVDLAMGAVRSLDSPFFGEFRDPESYIVEIYLLRKLCRDSEVKLVTNRIKALSERLKDPKQFHLMAQLSPRNRMLLALLDEKYIKGDSYGVSEAERVSEQGRIRVMLQKIADDARKPLLQKMSVVLAYAELAILDDIAFKPVKQLPSRAQFAEEGKELFAASELEDYVDEIGNHRLSGGNKCSAQAR